eukprot:12912575-Prorocentrum_lima.AAC.1
MSCPLHGKRQQDGLLVVYKKKLSDIESVYAAKDSSALAKLENKQSQIVRLEQVEQRLIQT